MHIKKFIFRMSALTLAACVIFLIPYAFICDMFEKQIGRSTLDIISVIYLIIGIISLVMTLTFDNWEDKK